MPKICVSLMGKTKEEIKNQCREILDMNIDIVEWRCDFFEQILNKEEVLFMINEIKTILKDKPLIFTIRSKEEGGEIIINKNNYMEILEKISKYSNVDIIDLELKVGDKSIEKLVSLAHKNNKKVIISKHDFEKTPSKDEMLEILLYMQKLKGDIPKLAVMAKSYLDVIKLLEVTATMKENYNTNTEDVVAIIGPSIGKCCYEVSYDLVEKFSALLPNADEKIYEIRDEKYYLDLWEINTQILKEFGVLKSNIINMNICTSCNCDRFFSYRKHDKTPKRIGTFIEIK